MLNTKGKLIINYRISFFTVIKPLKSQEMAKVKVANRSEQSRESSKAKSRIVQNESCELTKKSRIVVGANL